MAWQSPSANAGSHDGSNGGQGNTGSQNSGNGSQAVGTEYTLQGVMRFLQTEWHKHERDRNSWEIERAEMKARIAKLEGENRAAKRLQQGLMTRIKMLEIALKKKGEGVEGGKVQGSEGNSVLAKSPQSGHPINQHILADSSALHRAEAARNKSRGYLEKCLQEITYLLTPPSHPPPQQQSNLNLESILQQHQQQQQQLQQQHLQQQQLQQQQQQQQQQQSHPQFQQPSQAPNHQLPHPPVNHASQSLPRSRAGSHAHTHPQSHEMRSEQPQYHPEQQLPQPQVAIPEPMSREQSTEKSPNSAFSNSEYGNPDTNPFTASLSETSPSSVSNDPGDAWDFDETTRVGGADADPISASNNISDEYESSNHHSGKPTNSINKKKLSIRHRNEYPGSTASSDGGSFKVKFALRGHLDVVRAVTFTGGGSASEPEICTAGDDGVLKRWYIPGSYGLSMGVSDMDIQSHFTHRGHTGRVTCLAACPPIGGGEFDGGENGWIFSGGQDATVRVWEAKQVAPKATLVGHTDAVWAVCVLPSSSAMSGSTEERILLASGSCDGTVKIWSITPPPSSRGSSSEPGSRRGSVRSISSSSSNAQFSYSLISTIVRPGITASPTCITPMSSSGESFIVSYNDAAVIIYDTASGEEIVSMMSHETYDGTPATGVNSVVASTISLDSGNDSGKEEEALIPGATGPKGGVAGMVITGHEDQYVRIFDANSGQCTYTMLAHPAAISSLSLSPDGRELVSAGHDASLRFWSMEKRTCTQEITSHRLMTGEGVCAVAWSADGRWVVSGGGDGVVKVLAR